MRGRLALAGLFTAADYIHATRHRQQFIEELDNAMHHFDILLTATNTNEAPQIDTIGKYAIVEKPLLTIAFNVTGSPAMSICCGYSSTGLPLRMKIVGKRFDETTVLRVANAYEKATTWKEHHPNLD